MFNLLLSNGVNLQVFFHDEKIIISDLQKTNFGNFHGEPFIKRFVIGKRTENTIFVAREDEDELESAGSPLSGNDG